MTELTPPVLPELRTWQRIRQYAVPAAMIAACTEAREAGNWQAACAAGRIDIDFDLTELRREHGPKQVARIEADLAVLAPDLLRWHLPRALGGRTSLATRNRFLLSTHEDRVQDDDLALVLHTPKTVDGSQRMRLTVEEAINPVGFHGSQRDLPAAFWSAAHVNGLATIYGGSAQRLPGFESNGDVRPFEAYATTPDPTDPASRAEAIERHRAAGDLVAAWAAAGIDLDPTSPNRWTPPAAWIGVVNPVGLADELFRQRNRYDLDSVVVTAGYSFTVVRRRDDDSLAAYLVGNVSDIDLETYQLHRFAQPVYTRPADLDLLRHGLLDRTELHPLVHSALFPARVTDHTPTSTSTITTVAPGGSIDAGSVSAVARPDLRLSVPVRCQGEWHTVVHGDGRLELASHAPDEVARERALHAFGGPVPGCFAVLQAWQGIGGRLPRALRLLRRDVLQRIQHGGSTALTELLDAGLDPRMTDGRGGTLLHHMRAMDDASLVRRLVDAGVPIDAPTKRRETPLWIATAAAGTPELVRALLEAGADPNAASKAGITVAEIARYKAERCDSSDDDDDEVDVDEVDEDDVEVGGKQKRVMNLIDKWLGQ